MTTRPTPPGPRSVHAVARTIEPSAQDGWRLVGHYLHHRAHDGPRAPQDPQHWRNVDARAAACRDRLAWLPTARGQDVTVTLWLGLFDTERCCTDPGCAARTTYLASDGAGAQPSSGPLPAFAREPALAYFSYQTHPHPGGWAASVDPTLVAWMHTALALYGGYQRIDWIEVGGADTDFAVSLGHGLWKITDQQETRLGGHEVTSDTTGVHDGERCSVPAGGYPPLPPEVAAAQRRADATGAGLTTTGSGTAPGSHAPE